MPSKRGKSRVNGELAGQYRQNGNHFFGLGEYKEAEALYTKSLNAKKSAVTFANRAQLHIQCDRPDDAIRDARAALALDPQYLKARFRLGQALAMNGALEEAMAELEKCRIAEPNNRQIRQEIDKCKKALKPPISAASPTCTDNNGVPPISFSHLMIIAWPEEELRLATQNGHMFEFDNVAHLQIVLHTTKAICGPIAHIVVQECDVGDEIFKFFRSLNPKLLDGCTLELLGVRASSKQQFAQFIALFRPIGIHVAPVVEVPPWMSCSRFPCDYSSAILRVPALRSAKYLMFRIPSKYMVYPSLNISDLMDWLHSSRSDFPPAQGACSEPPTEMAQLGGVMVGNITSVLEAEEGAEFASVWRFPAHRVLQFHAHSLVQAEKWQKNGNKKGKGNRNNKDEEEDEDSDSDDDEQQKKKKFFRCLIRQQHTVVEQFINECNKKFHQATKPISYTVKLFCKMSEPQIKIRSRRFTNALGEHLLVNLQHLERSEMPMHPFFANIMPSFPPLDLVLIQRFHPK